MYLPLCFSVYLHGAEIGQTILYLYICRTVVRGGEKGRIKGGEGGGGGGHRCPGI